MGGVKLFAFELLDSINEKHEEIEYYYNSSNGQDLIESINFLKENKYKIAILYNNEQTKKLSILSAIKANIILKNESNAIEIISKELKIKPSEIIFLSHKKECKNNNCDYIWIYEKAKENSESYEGDKLKKITKESMDTIVSYLSLFKR
jgi:hypothetical protein